ncbi:MAG: tryptophan synthase alpha chain [Methanofollis sp.]|nr:tryptophan synthase alpha chain [Methanofollis sp.]
MSRIAAAFTGAKRPLLVVYLVGGDPDPDASLAAATAIVEGGADILEIGIPFTDPIADGPVIQEANVRALAAGMTTDRIFALVRAVRGRSAVPIVLMTSYNPVYVRGDRRFCRDARDAGADAVLITDLPPEESGPFDAAAREYGLDRIFLVAPNTPETRLPLIADLASGFLYLISVQGVTGVRENLDPAVSRRVAALRSATSLPVAVGFGISRPDHVREIAGARADAAVVGSAVVRIVGEHGGDVAAMQAALRTYVAGMRAAAVLPGSPQKSRGGSPLDPLRRGGTATPLFPGPTHK